MASPISYSSRDPRQVRAILATTYERYASGIDLFPKKRLAFPADHLGKRSVRYGLMLEGAWGEIDTDREYFRDSLKLIGAITLESGKKHTSVIRIGRNAVALGTADAHNGHVDIGVSVVSIDDMKAMIRRGVFYHATGNRVSVNEEGDIKVEPADLVVIDLDHGRGANYFHSGAQNPILSSRHLSPPGDHEV